MGRTSRYWASSGRHPLPLARSSPPSGFHWQQLRSSHPCSNHISAVCRYAAIPCLDREGGISSARILWHSRSSPTRASVVRLLSHQSADSRTALRRGAWALSCQLATSVPGSVLTPAMASLTNEDYYKLVDALPYIDGIGPAEKVKASRAPCRARHAGRVGGRCAHLQQRLASRCP